MGVTLQWEGLDEFRAALRALPAQLEAEATTTIDGAAQTTADRLTAAYPDKTGELRAGVSVQKFSMSAIVVSASPVAHLWEFGTQVRETQKGFNRGAEPAHYNLGLVGIAEQERREMYADLIAIVEEAGFDVIGTLP